MKPSVFTALPPRKQILFSVFFLICALRACPEGTKDQTMIKYAAYTSKSRTMTHKPEKFSLTTFLSKYGRWLPPLSALFALLIWQLIAQFGGLPAFILPSPWQVFTRFATALLDGSLVKHSLVTFSEVILGLMVGCFLATFAGYWLARSRVLEHTLAPYLVASQAVPVVAIAPLLIIWFGPGMFSKVLICALMVFFPVLVNTVVGLRAVPENLGDLMRSLKASRLQMLVYLQIPAALPVFLGGLRVGATLSVIGATVGEFVGADQGLGFLINIGRGQYDTALVFVSIFTLVMMALALYGLVILIEHVSLRWQRSSGNE
ncbi:MAG: ABC transporter permease [Anaerolineae bacterium]|nr:ABC transporter permease [Anaerolineae bacterium]